MKKTILLLVVGVITAGAAYYLFTQDERDLQESYEAYVKACTASGEEEFTCRCQGNMLKARLTGKELSVLTEVGKAVEQNNLQKVSELQKEYPQIFKVMSEIPDDAANCVLE